MPSLPARGTSRPPWSAPSCPCWATTCRRNSSRVSSRKLTLTVSYTNSVQDKRRHCIRTTLLGLNSLLRVERKYYRNKHDHLEKKRESHTHTSTRNAPLVLHSCKQLTNDLGVLGGFDQRPCRCVKVGRKVYEGGWVGRKVWALKFVRNGGWNVQCVPVSEVWGV